MENLWESDSSSESDDDYQALLLLAWKRMTKRRRRRSSEEEVIRESTTTCYRKCDSLILTLTLGICECLGRGLTVSCPWYVIYLVLYNDSYIVYY